MKRRTFLKLSPAFVALPLSLGLNGCTASISPSSVSSIDDTDMVADDIDDDLPGLGMTLEEIQEFADRTNRHIFIHRSDDLFYVLPTPLTGIYNPSRKDFYNTVFSDPEMLQTIYDESTPSRNNITLSWDGDELVYITSSSLPDSVTFSSFIGSGPTLPFFINDRNDGFGSQFRTLSPFYDPFYNEEGDLLQIRRFSDYDPSYIPAAESDQWVINVGTSRYTDLRINNIPLDDYIDSHTLVPFCWPSSERLPRSFVALDSDEYGSPITVSYYRGSNYYEIHLSADCKFYMYDAYNPISCNLMLTKNGYAVIDCSSLSQNMRYMVLDTCDHSPAAIVNFSLE